MGLDTEIESKAKEIHTDSYPMSIGELVNLYRDGELDLQPEFQRFFRWTSLQKSKLVESILLGIPIPSIFVAQRKADGVWDVVDGLQRLSTIFEFLGILRNEAGKLLPPVALEGTEYLPSLQGKVWDSDAMEKLTGTEALAQAQRLAIKRTKLMINIVRKESAEDTRLELFNRLNTLGTKLSDQEQRNCQLLMVDRQAFSWANKLSEFESFKKTIIQSDAMLEQRYDVELVWRFMCIPYTNTEQHKRIVDIADFITKTSLQIAADKGFDRDNAEGQFRGTFALLDECLGEDAFRKFEVSSKRFVRSFLLSSFEATALGVRHNLAALTRMGADDRRSFILRQVQAMWASECFLNNMGSGVTPARRISNLVPFGHQHFAP